MFGRKTLTWIGTGKSAQAEAAWRRFDAALAALSDARSYGQAGSSEPVAPLGGAKSWGRWKGRPVTRGRKLRLFGGPLKYTF